MKIIFQGKNTTTPDGITLAELVRQTCKKPEHVIAELNGAIIQSVRWNESRLKDGDAVELVTFVGGG
jgi:sulfur carrier protein